MMIQVGGGWSRQCFGDVRYFTVLGAALIGGMLVATLTTPRLYAYDQTADDAGHPGRQSRLPVGFSSCRRGAIHGLPRRLFGRPDDDDRGPNSERLDLDGPYSPGSPSPSSTARGRRSSGLRRRLGGLSERRAGQQRMRSGIWLSLTLLPGERPPQRLLPLRAYAVPERDLPVFAARRAEGGAVTSNRFDRTKGMVAMTTASVLLGDGLAFGEGPRWRDGRLWFSDFYRRAVFTLTEDGAETEVVDVPTQPSGLGWLPDGRLLVSSMTDRTVLRLEPDGTLAVHADLTAYADHHVNDLVTDATGGRMSETSATTSITTWPSAMSRRSSATRAPVPRGSSASTPTDP